MNTPGARLLCPVCHRTVQGLMSCGHCGTPVRGGAADEADERRFADQIAVARRRYDMRAVMRAAGPMGDRDLELLTRLGSFVRGGRPQSAEIAAAELDEARYVPPRDTAVGIGFPLTRLVAGETDAIEFVEIGPEGISAQALIVDELGVPVLTSDASHRILWPRLLPVLPEDDALRRFWLAGGIGEFPPADPAELVTSIQNAASQAVRQLLADMATAGGPGGDRRARSAPHADRVLVYRAHRWLLLDAVAARIRGVARPVAEVTDLGQRTLAEIVRQIATRAPLRYEYVAVLVSVDSQGSVAVVERTLFPPGTAVRRQDRPTEPIIVQAPPLAANLVALPVVAKRGPKLASWPEVGRAILDGATVGTISLRVQLEAPGHVHFMPRQMPDDGTVPSWPGLLQDLPQHLPGGVPADVVVLVEVGGSDAAVRLDLLDNLLAQIDHPDVRVAIVGYRDHSVHAGPTVHGSGLDRIEKARAELGKLRRWPAGKVGHDHAAPIEDALDWVVKQGLGWRPRARHILVVCGARPPHHAGEDDYTRVLAAGCPYNIDWKERLDQLRSEQAAESYVIVHENAVRDPPNDYAEVAWESLAGSNPPLFVESTSADQLARELRLAIGEGGPRLHLAALADKASET